MSPDETVAYRRPLSGFIYCLLACSCRELRSNSRSKLGKFLMLDWLAHPLDSQPVFVQSLWNKMDMRMHHFLPTIPAERT